MWLNDVTIIAIVLYVGIAAVLALLVESMEK